MGKVLRLVGGLFYFAAHVLFDLLSMCLRGSLELLGEWEQQLWALAVLCLVVLLLDWAGQIRLGSGWTLTAGLTLPLVGAGVDILFREDGLNASLALWTCLLSGLLLDVYLILRAPGRNGPVPEQCDAVAAAAGLWVFLFVGAMMLLVSYGLLVTLILGAILANGSKLMEYPGIIGMLAGVGGLCLLGGAWIVTTRRRERMEYKGLEQL